MMMNMKVHVDELDNAWYILSRMMRALYAQSLFVACKWRRDTLVIKMTAIMHASS
jgi:hypothetical protein